MVSRAMATLLTSEGGNFLDFGELETTVAHVVVLDRREWLWLFGAKLRHAILFARSHFGDGVLEQLDLG